MFLTTSTASAPLPGPKHMPSRPLIATNELAKLLSALSHRHRVQLIKELRLGERDVTSLACTLDISTSRVSQHLTTLKAHHLVRERREGRHVYYRLARPEVAVWLAEGLSFVESELLDDTDLIHEAVEHTRHMWLSSEE